MAINFGEELKRVVMAGVGAVAMTAEKSKELIDVLVEKGELTVEQGKAMNEELRRNVQEKVKENVTLVVKNPNVDKVVEKMDSMTPEEIEKIKAKLAEMEATNSEKDEEDNAEGSDNA